MHVEMSRDIVTWPYTAAGRSRRGPHNAGTTVQPNIAPLNFLTSIYSTEKLNPDHNDNLPVCRGMIGWWRPSLLLWCLSSQMT